MVLDIGRFRAEINKNGVLQNNKYEVLITAPKYIIGNVGDEIGVSGTDLTLRCISAQLPGASIATIDSHPRYGYGPIDPMPYSFTTNDCMMTFLLDSNSKVHRFFYNWNNYVVNTRAIGMSDLSLPTGKKGWKPFEVGYKSDYATTIQVSLFDNAGRRVAIASLYNAWPKTLPPFDVSFENTNDLIKLPIDFAYSDFEWDHVSDFIYSELDPDARDTIRDNPSIF